MKTVLELAGEGDGKECIIIGGGESVNTLDWLSLPRDMVRIQCNVPYHGFYVDYCIYWEKICREEYNRLGIKSTFIAHEDHKTDQDHYYYDPSFMPMFDTGLNALFLASEIMLFNKIYIIGYDYYGDHYHGLYPAPRTKWFKKAPEMYDRPWIADIYNLNEKSEIKLFKYDKSYTQLTKT